MKFFRFQEIKLKEAMEGLGPTVSDEDSEGDDEIVETTEETYRPAVAPISAENRKLSAVRKREKVRKLQEKERRKQKLERMRQSEVYRYNFYSAFNANLVATFVFLGFVRLRRISSGQMKKA